MRTKLIIPLFACLLYCGFAIAQDLPKTTYHKTNGIMVATEAEADFTRTISAPDAGTTLFNVTEYYKDKTVKLKAKSSMAGPIIYEGELISYYPNGQKREVLNFTRGKKSGAGYRYFPDGKLYTFAVYQTENKPGYAEMIMDCNDITGKVRAKNGTGYYVGYDGDFNNILEEGPIVNSLRDGAWKGNNGSKDYRVDFTEQYKEGVITEGKSVDKDGKHYTYTVREIQPQYTGGLQAFGQFLGDNIKYPANARNNRIQGSVFLSFVVQADGTLADIKALRSPDAELSAEAIRVIESTPNWIPGKQYGRPVRVSYTVPIKFTLP